MKAEVAITDSQGLPYIPQEGDLIQFAVKKSYEDTDYLILKEIPKDTMILTLEPEDTKHLPYGSYVYDMQLTRANGEVDTFITKSTFIVTEEVC